MASNSFVIICKKYYVEVILRQITAITDENHTYCKVDKCCDQIVVNNTEYIQ